MEPDFCLKTGPVIPCQVLDDLGPKKGQMKF